MGTTSIDSDALRKLRARCVYFYAASRDTESVEISRARLVKLLGLPRYDKALIEGVVEELGEFLPCKIEATGLVARPEAPESVRDLFVYWQETTGKRRTKLTDKRRRLIRKALRSYPAEDLRKAIDGLASSPWHRGDNPQGVPYLGIEYAIRDGKTIERLRDFAEGSQGYTYEQIAEEWERRRNG